MCPYWGAWTPRFRIGECRERQGAECAPTHSSGTWTFPQQRWRTAADEVVVDGLPLHGGAQLAVDTTLVSTFHGDGRPRKGAADRDGVALLASRKRKERRYPEFLGARCKAHLVVLAVEVGGRFPRVTSDFISELARARARWEIPLIRKRRASLAVEMVRLVCLRCSEGIRSISVGDARSSGRGWQDARVS